MGKNGKVLIIFLPGIGNIVLFLPILRAIRKANKNTQLDILVKHKVVCDLIEDGLVDKYYFLNNKNKSLKIFEQLLLLLNIRENRYDMVIVHMASAGLKTSIFVKLLDCNKTIGYARGKWYDSVYTNLIIANNNEHELEWNNKILTAIGVNDYDSEYGIFLNDKIKTKVEEILNRNGIYKDDIIIGIHPGSSEYLKNKRWPADRFLEVINYLSKKCNAKILLFGGNNETRLAEFILSQTEGSVLNFTGQTDIITTAGLIKRCRLFISNDSGLMHIAAGVGTKVIAIFGPTNPVKNAPKGRDNIVVRKELPCSPCSKYINNECKDMECLKRVTVDDVIKEIERSLLTSIKGLSMN
jgi:heptosyltransferase II